MKTLLKAPRPRTETARAVLQKDVEAPAPRSADITIRTRLIESCGWPTAEMQPSKRQATRR